MHPRFTKRINDIQRAKQNQEVMKSLQQADKEELISTEQINKQIKLLEKRVRILEQLLVEIIQPTKPRKR